MKTIHTVHIIGMGALGTLFGKRLQDALGPDAVSYVVDDSRYERYLKKETTINGEPVKFHFLRAEDATPADLVFVAVKARALSGALETMKSSIGENTVILSVMNGITSEEIIGERYGYDKLIETVAQGMDAMRFGDTLTYTKFGQLNIGIVPGQKQENLDAVADLFARAGIPHVVEANILHRLWSKFMLNVGVNQTCMVYGTTYSGVLEKGEPNRTFISAMREVIAIANAEGVDLSEADLRQYVDIIRTLSPDGTPSMGQDRINHNKSEVEFFAGTVKKIAAKHSIPVPVNEFLYDRVQEIESEY